MPTTVRKRDGQAVQPFDVDKVRAAIRGAWVEVRGEADEAAIRKIAKSAIAELPDDVAEVERVQDEVERALMRSGRHDIARAFILYRDRRASVRAGRPAPDRRAISDYIHASKYARWSEDLGRRELFSETVDRVEAMHARRFADVPGMGDEIRAAFDAVRRQEVLPSMRSMQFGGAAIEAVNPRLFNCSATLIDRPRAFAEALYLLLCGCGVGYSVQFEHVDRLPPVARIDDLDAVHHVVGDTIEGWADALDALVRSYLVEGSEEYGRSVEFAFHEVRRRGSRLRTSGGRAPGHRKLKESLERIRDVMAAAQGRQLRPIECHRICCHAAAAVLSGGIRRSAMICLFSPEDGEIMVCKSDASWFSREPWLAYANNSAVLVRGEATRKMFHRIFQLVRAYGEPGAYFVEDPAHVTNPCAEIGLDPTIMIGVLRTGWSFCNLCEINASKLRTRDDFLAAARAATLIGTLQADYTSMPYLGEVSEAIARRDALIGVGMTGMQDSPAIALDSGLQREVAARVREWNAEFAARLGINAAARTTCVKPSGTTSLELGYVASGIHRHHARRIIRRVTADELEIPFRAFRERNPHACVRMPDGKWSIEFAVEAPPGAALREDVGAIAFVDQVLSTQESWVLPGTARESGIRGQRHNVSNTITVRPGEWEALEEHLWQNRRLVGGVSMLPDDGDVVYPFAPFEAVRTAAQEARWLELVTRYQPVDYSTIAEDDDGTALAGEAACAGGACEVRP